MRKHVRKGSSLIVDMALNLEKEKQKADFIAGSAFQPYVRPPRDEDLTYFGPDPTPPISYAGGTNSDFRGARPTTPTAPSYAATGGGAVLPTVATAPGIGVVPIRDVVPEAPAVRGPTNKAVLPPLLRTGYAMAELAAAADLQMATAINKAVTEHNAKVAKTAPIAKSTNLRVSVVKSGR
jgi:hypothetical protein